MSASDHTSLDDLEVLELRVSRTDFVVVAADTLRRVVSGRDGALHPEDSGALMGAITRTGSGVEVQVRALPPQVVRLTVFVHAGTAAELNVLSDRVLRARYVVPAGDAREALVLRRRGASWTVRAPATRIGDLAVHLASLGAPSRITQSVAAASAARTSVPSPAPEPVAVPTPRSPSVPPAGGAHQPTTPPGVSPGRVRRRRFVMAAAAILIGGAGGAALMLGFADSPNGRGSRGADANPPASPRVAQKPSVQRQAKEVKQALVRLPADPSSLLSAQRTDQSAGTARQAVPAGTRVSVDEGSWAPDGLGGGAVEVTLNTPDGKQDRYVAVMVNENGAWKVLSTIPVTP